MAHRPLVPNDIASALADLYDCTVQDVQQVAHRDRATASPLAAFGVNGKDPASWRRSARGQAALR